MTTLDFTFHMKSDWSVSTGNGRQGALDSTVHKDSDGLPVIPFTTIRGIWRDSAEQLAYALDDGNEKGAWQNFVALMFGDEPAQPGFKIGHKPRPSRLRVSDAQLPEAVREQLKGEARARLRAALTFVKPGVAIDPINGTAIDNFLRFDEMVRAGVDLTCSVSFDTENLKHPKVAENFVTAAILLIEQIGGNRRRGAGLCEVTNKNKPLKDALNALKDVQIPELAPLDGGNVATASSIQTVVTAVGASEFKTIELSVELMSPTVIPRAILGNVTTCEDYIPGTFLLSPVAGFLADKLKTSKDVVMAHIAAGRICVEPAYPSLGGVRGTPVPANWFQYKDEAGGPNGKGKIIVGSADANKAPKPVSEKYFIAREKLEFPSIRKGVLTRNSVDDKSQRPNSSASGGGVFTYEHLKPGQILISKIWIDAGICGNAILAGNTTAYIGRASMTGYGSAKLKFGSTIAHQGIAHASNEIELLVQTPVIVSQPKQLSNMQQVFEQMLGLGSGNKITSSDIRYQRIEGWVASWGLPRESLLAISPGSIFKIKLEAADYNALNAALKNGVGARRGEGYGRIVEAPRIAANLLEAPKVKATSNNNDISRTKVKVASAENIEKAAFENAIRLAAETVSHTAEWRTQNLGWPSNLTNSQLGALRSVMGNLEDEQRKEAVVKYLAKKKEEDSWRTETQKLFADQELVWTKLKIPDPGNLALSNTLEDAKKKYRLYAIKTLIHAAMAHARKAS
jgi:CRISPR-associated protein Csx10